MALDSLAPALARAERRLLDQYLIDCPGCHRPAAVHVDGNDVPSGGRPRLVRLVCPQSCSVAEEDALSQLSVGEVTLSA